MHASKKISILKKINSNIDVSLETNEGYFAFFFYYNERNFDVIWGKLFRKTLSVKLIKKQENRLFEDFKGYVSPVLNKFCQ